MKDDGFGFTDDEIRDAAIILEASGVGMYVPGCYDVNPKTILKALNDRDGFEADQHGITREAWIKYQQFIASYSTCNGITKKGLQCKNRCLYCGGGEGDLSGFRFGYHDRCSVHGGPTNYEWSGRFK